jgi:peptidoglycan L-alanyl-D-glutamate endopeptidase CwlK
MPFGNFLRLAVERGPNARIALRECCERGAQTIMNNISLARLSEVHPILKDKILKMEEILQEEAIALVVSEGLRPWSVQDALYQRGRILQDGIWVVTSPQDVVTNAPPGHSWHQFGLAVDCEPEVKLGQVDWNPQHPQWLRMEELGRSLGLVSGADWLRIKDAPHFQLTGQFPVSPNDEVRQLFADAGMETIWAEAGIVA